MSLQKPSRLVVVGVSAQKHWRLPLSNEAMRGPIQTNLGKFSGRVVLRRAKRARAKVLRHISFLLAQCELLLQRQHETAAMSLLQGLQFAHRALKHGIRFNYFGLERFAGGVHCHCWQRSKSLFTIFRVCDN